MKRVLRRYLDAPHERLRLEGRVLAPWWRWRFAEFGAGAMLVRPRWINGAHKIAIGPEALIFPGVWLAAERSAWDRPAPALRIGAGCVLRPGVVVSAAEEVVIEDDVGLGGSVLVIDSDHTWDAGRANITANPLRTAPVRIGRGCYIGDRASILRGSRVGAFSIVGTNSVVRGEFPDFSILAGVPAKVVGSTRDRVPDAAIADRR